MKLHTRQALAFAAAAAIFCSGTGMAIPASAALRGDVTGDAAVTSEDAQLVLQAAVELLASNPSPLSAEASADADVDSDGAVTVSDAQYILVYYVNNTLTHNPKSWEDVIGPNPEETLTILCRSDWYISQMIQQYETAHPESAGKIKYKNITADIVSPADLKAFYTGCMNGGDADLILLEENVIGDYLESDQYTRPITELGFAESDFESCYSYTLTVGKNKAGVLKAVTPFANPGGYAYRADLAEKYLGVSTPEEMQLLVKDWDTFTETAEKLHKATGGKTAMTATLQGMSYPWSGSRGESWFDADGNLQIGSSAKEFGKLLRLFKEKGYATNEGQWTDDWYEIGHNDSTMGYFFSSWCLADHAMLYYAEGEENGAAYGKYRFTEGPSPYFWGGEWLAATSKCNTKQLAHDFIEYFVLNPDAMASFAEEHDDCFMNNSEAMLKIDYSNPYLGGQNPYPVLDRNAKAIDLEGWYSPYDADKNWSYADYVATKVTDDTSDEEMLKGFSRFLSGES